MNVVDDKKKNKIWSFISMAIYMTVLIAMIIGIYTIYQNNRTTQLMRQSKQLNKNVSELMEKSLTLYSNRDVNDFLSRIATQETINGFTEQADKLIETHQYLDEQAKKLQIKNYQVAEIKELTEFNKQIKHHLEVRNSVNNMFESNYIERNKPNKEVVIRADLKRKEIKKVKKIIEDSTLSTKVKKEYLKGIDIANNQMKQLEEAAKAILTIYNKGEIVPGIGRMDYESVYQEVEDVKNGTLKKSFERGLIAVDNNLKKYEQQERKNTLSNKSKTNDNNVEKDIPTNTGNAVVSNNKQPTVSGSDEENKSNQVVTDKNQSTTNGKVESEDEANNTIIISPQSRMYSPWFTSADGRQLIKMGDYVFQSKEDALKWLSYYIDKYENEGITSSNYGIDIWEG